MSLGMRGILGGAFLSSRDRSDVRDVPPNPRERFHSGNDPDNQKRDVNKRLDDPPKKDQDSANPRDRPQDQEEDS